MYKIDSVNDEIILEQVVDNILIIQFNHPNKNNPFNKKLEVAVCEALVKANTDPNIGAVILTGGVGRSFSVGGDFNEVKQLKGNEDVELWIDGIVELYTSCLKINKPTIAAVDLYSIGIGFQLALMCDYRIGTERSIFYMPELSHGIACTLGQYIVEKQLSRAAMLEIVYGCEKIPAKESLNLKLSNKIVSADQLIDEALKLAKALSEYPKVSFYKTKSVINESFIEGMYRAAEKSKNAHKLSFQSGVAQKFMKKIVSPKVRKTLRKSFFISNQSVRLNIEGFGGEKIGDFFLGLFDEYPINVNDNLCISFEHFNVVNEIKNGENTAVINKNCLTLTGSEMNTQAIYYYKDEGRNLFFACNDLLIIKDLLEYFKIPVHYDIHDDMTELTFFDNINRLKAGEKLTIKNINNALEVNRESFSKVFAPRPKFKTIEEASKEFFDVLYAATKELTKEYDDVYITLSGGIDSGTIAYILKDFGKKVHAYTLGTEWGNEFKEAEETANYLGIPLEKIYLPKEYIINKIPELIRYFTFNNPLSIEIALVAFCIYTKLQHENVTNKVFVSGYGSDLINAGIFSSFNDYSELEAEIINSLKKTQLSNEFSNLAANNLGITAIHPFWHTDVIRTALSVPAEFKVRDNKDKFFFRKEMEKRLPASIAWRTKIGAHQGTGITENIIKHLLQVENGANDPSKSRRVYKELINTLHKDLFFNKRDISEIKMSE